MSSTAICTITTASHLFKVKALYDSLEGRTAAAFHCLVTDGRADAWKNISMHGLNALTGPEAEAIKKKYHGNKLRWACKPLFLLHLLEQYERVIYVDNDICFYSSPDFLFDRLQEKSILLTPHYYPAADPAHDQLWLEANYRVGLYNAGFTGASRSGAVALQWWAKCCLYTMQKNYWRGLFDDQKYLDLFPVLFDGVEIVKHKGCNVAGWNIRSSPRSVDADENMLLDGRWPLVFVHYNYYTIDCILKGKDPCLENAWAAYLQRLQLYDAAYIPRHDAPGAAYRMGQYLQYLRYRWQRRME